MQQQQLLDRKGQIERVRAKLMAGKGGKYRCAHPGEYSGGGIIAAFFSPGGKKRKAGAGDRAYVFSSSRHLTGSELANPPHATLHHPWLDALGAGGFTTSLLRPWVADI